MMQIVHMCGYCNSLTVDEQKHAKGWFVLILVDLYEQTFCSYNCLVKWLVKHPTESNAWDR